MPRGSAGPFNLKSTTIALDMLSLFFAVASALPSENIVGGTIATPFEYPFITSLQVDNDHICGGVLLNPTTVLTAGHCSEGIDDVSVLSVKVHRHDLSKSESTEQGATLTVSEIINSPGFRQVGDSLMNDISIWKVSLKSGKLPKEALTIGSAALEKPGTLLTVAGWGRTRENGAVSRVLREVSIPVVDFDACKKFYPDLHSSSFCAGYEKGGKDSCQGDSGGPMFQVVDDKVVLVGVVSYGNGCARLDPGVYTRVSAFKSFIQSHL